MPEATPFMALAAFLGGALPAVIVALLSFSRHRDENVLKEQKAVLQVARELRVELQEEILDLRRQLLKLQEDHLRCTSENAELKARIRELESDMSWMRSTQTFPCKNDIPVIFDPAVREEGKG